IGYIFPVRRYLQRADAAPSGRPAPGPAASGNGEGKRKRGLESGTILRRMLLGACLSGVALVGTWASVQLAPSWAAKLVDATTQREGRDPRSKDVQLARDSARSLTQIISGLGAIIGTIAGALVAKAIGRRATYTALCVGSLVASLLFYLSNA